MAATRSARKSKTAGDDDASDVKNGHGTNGKAAKSGGGGLSLVSLAVALFAIAIAAGFGAKQAGVLDGVLESLPSMAPVMGTPEPLAPTEAEPAEPEAPAEPEPAAEEAPAEPEPTAGFEPAEPEPTEEAPAEPEPTEEAPAEAEAAGEAVPPGEAAAEPDVFQLYVRNTNDELALRVLSATEGVALDDALAPGEGKHYNWGKSHAFLAGLGEWSVEITAFTTDAADQAFAFKNNAAGPVSLEVHGASEIVTIAPGAAEGFVAGDGHHFWMTDETGARRFGVAAFPADGA